MNNDTAERDEFLNGFAIALATVQRLHDDPTAVDDAIKSNGLTIADFRKAGVDNYDLNVLRYCTGELKRMPI